jgi:hypothetical protein
MMNLYWQLDIFHTKTSRPDGQGQEQAKQQIFPKGLFHIFIM